MTDDQVTNLVIFVALVYVALLIFNQLIAKEDE